MFAFSRSRMSWQVCVTRYQEDLAWLQSIALHVHVMNKGDDRLYGISNTRIPNRGHEEARSLLNSIPVLE